MSFSFGVYFWYNGNRKTEGVDIMGKKNKHVTVEHDDNRIRLEFDTMFYVKAARRQVPPPTRVEMPKKGKGSYNRKDKHKGRFRFDYDGISFYICNSINAISGEF